MNIKKNERGQALILIALAAIGLFAFAALAIDGSMKFSDRRHAQNAADNAALAAALAKIRGQNYVAAAENIARENGYDKLAPNTMEVEAKLCNDPTLDAPCQGLPAGANQAEYIRVRIKSRVNYTFSRVFGQQYTTNTVEAVVRAHVSNTALLAATPVNPVAPTDTPNTSYAYTPTNTPAPGSTTVVTTGGSLFGNSALVSTKGGNHNQCFLMNGSADLYIHNSGIFINCSGSQAVFLNGSSDLNMDTTGQVVGCYFENGNANYDPIACGINGGVSLPFSASTFAGVPRTQTPPTCSTNGSISGNVFSPGNFGNITINSGANVTFNPGTYCISGGFNLNGNATLQAPAGRVQFVLQDQYINMNGGTIIDFNDFEIYGNNATFTLNGGAIFRADRMRFFSTGNGNFIVNGNSELTSGDAYFYLRYGNITWNGGSKLTLRAPMQGDPFGGLLVYKPWENQQMITLNGGSDIHLTGTFMVPSSPVTFNGGVDFELHSQIIGYEYIVNGNADVDIYYVASENYNTSTIVTGSSTATAVPPTWTPVVPTATTTAPPPTATSTPTPGASIELIH